MGRNEGKGPNSSSYIIIPHDMSHSLNSLKGGYIGIIYGTIMEVIKGDTRSLDNGSYGNCRFRLGKRRERKRRWNLLLCSAYIYIWVKGYPPPLHFVHFPYNSMPFKHNVILHALPSSI